MTTKIRICSDSIGAGYPFYTGYRSRLARAMGGAVSWTGTQTTEWIPGQGYVPQPGTMLRHEAHGGISVDGFNAKLKTFLAATSLVDDVFLVQLGVNDYAQSTPKQIVAKLRALSDQMSKLSPSTEQIVMPPTPVLPTVNAKASLDIEKMLHDEVGTWQAPYFKTKVRTAPLTFFRAGFDKNWKDVLISDATHLTRYGFELLSDDLTIALGKAPLPRETPPPTTPVSTNVPKPEERDGKAVIFSGWDGIQGPLSWSTGPDDATYITDAEGRLILDTLDASSKKLFEERVRRWQPIVQEMGAKYGFPPAWTLGVIWAESRGDQYAKNNENPPGLGLMQITAPVLKQGHSDQEFLDNPRLNIETGVKYLSTLLHLFGRRLPEIASGYNAGVDLKTQRPHDSDDPLWRMRNTKGYIGAVLQGANTALGYPPGAKTYDVDVTVEPHPKPAQEEDGGSGGLLVGAAAALGIGALLFRR